MENNNQYKRKSSNIDELHNSNKRVAIESPFDNINNVNNMVVNNINVFNNFYSNYAKLKAINICNQLDTHNYDVNIIRLRDALAKNPILNFKSFQHLHRTILHILTLNKNISITEMIIRELIEGLKLIDSIYYIEYAFDNMNITNLISKFINEKDDNNCTALHYASRLSNNLSIIRYLVENGANVNVQDNCGFSPLHYASQVDDNSNVLIYLMDNGAIFNLPTEYGMTPLYFMCRSNNNINAIKHIEDKITLDDIDFSIDNRTKKITKVEQYLNSEAENISKNTFQLLYTNVHDYITLYDKIIKDNLITYSITNKISNYDYEISFYFNNLKKQLKAKSTTNA